MGAPRLLWFSHCCYALQYSTGGKGGSSYTLRQLSGQAERARIQDTAGVESVFLMPVTRSSAGAFSALW